MDADLIIKLGFFIGDLHRQIEQLHKEQFADPSSNQSFSAYRGQGMDKKQFEQMTTSKGGLLSFNCFLSTSKDHNVSLKFAQRATTNADMIGVLFVITINPAQSTTPFASIAEYGHFGDNESEILFSMHTVFRIGNITPMDENHRLFKVELTLTSDNDKDLRRLTDCIREETFPNSTGWYRLGLVLLKMGQPQRAQRVNEILLEQETEKSAKAPIYDQLGCIKANLGEYQEAIRFYEKSLAIEQQSLPPNHPNLAGSYGNIGVAYQNMGDYPKALSYFEKALAIRQQSLPPNHPDLASSYNNIGSVYGNIGSVYGNMGDYSKALSSFEKALAIKQQSLPPNHPDLASSYNNIGSVYGIMGDYSKALSSFEKALAIKQQSLPPNSPSLAISHYNMGSLYEEMGNNSKACSSYERAVETGQNSLPSNHSHLRIYQEALADIKKKM
jgi:tetratricopeptide (TPR) repeat protein